MLETQKTLNVKAPGLTHVAQLVRALPADRRRAFTLRKVYGYSGREIAGRLGIPEQAVEALLIQAARVCAQADSDVQSLARRPSLLERFERLRSRIIHA